MKPLVSEDPKMPVCIHMLPPFHIWLLYLVTIFERLLPVLVTCSLPGFTNLMHSWNDPSTHC